MAKNFKLFLILLLTVVISSLKLKTQTKCVNLKGDCDLTSYCCGKYVCKDYRCSEEGTKENQVSWAPNGEKCDFFHHCKKSYKCESHRCILYTNKIVDNIRKKLNGDF
jgi:hypothetical protein